MSLDTCSRSSTVSYSTFLCCFSFIYFRSLFLGILMIWMLEMCSMMKLIVSVFIFAIVILFKWVCWLWTDLYSPSLGTLLLLLMNDDVCETFLCLVLSLVVNLFVLDLNSSLHSLFFHSEYINHVIFFCCFLVFRIIYWWTKFRECSISKEN